MESFDTDPGDSDTVLILAGDAQIIGGIGSDTITVGDGSGSLLAGDGAVITRAPNGNPVSFLTTTPSIGGNDTIQSGSGNDVLFGGFGADLLRAGAGNDVVIGDSARVLWTNGTRVLAETVDLYLGGNDFLEGGDGLDILIGGHGDDTLSGTLADDIMAGDYAVVNTPLAQPINVSKLGVAGGAPDLIFAVMVDLYRPTAVIAHIRDAETGGSGESTYLASGEIDEALVGQFQAGSNQRFVEPDSLVEPMREIFNPSRTNASLTLTVEVTPMAAIFTQADRPQAAPETPEASPAGDAAEQQALKLQPDEAPPDLVAWGASLWAALEARRRQRLYTIHWGNPAGTQKQENIAEKSLCIDWEHEPLEQ
jgi:hypothetical protein